VVEWCKINRKECLFYMKQLKMRRPSAPVKELPLPAGYRYELYSGTREEIDATAGTGYVFRPLESHGGHAVEDSVVIEVFCPTREPLTRD